MTKKWLRIVLVAFLAILAISVVGFVTYSRLATAEPEPTALEAMNSDGLVKVEERENGWLIFKPVAGSSQAGLVLYPGAYVDPRAYAPAARDIAAAGYLVVIPTMPLNLAILGANRAGDIIDAFPEIEHWVVGGHSLGGAMAAQFVSSNLGVADGLALWGAYPGGNVDLSSSGLQAASIYGDRDGLSEIETVEAARPQLPADSDWLLIEGGNHAQFGWYGPQRGDMEPEIDHDEQQALTVAGTVRLLERIGP